jgi:hypothetical protein
MLPYPPTFPRLSILTSFFPPGLPGNELPIANHHLFTPDLELNFFCFKGVLCPQYRDRFMGAI